MGMGLDSTLDRAYARLRRSVYIEIAAWSCIEIKVDEIIKAIQQ